MEESLVGGFAGGDGDGGGGCAHGNRCLRAKAVFTGSDKFPANETFAASCGGVVAVVAVVVVGVVEAMQGEVVVGWSFCVVMGATRKRFHHRKRFHGSIFFDPLPPNFFHGTFF